MAMRLTRLEIAGELAFRRHIATADDARLERLSGSRALLRLLFWSMTRRFEPAKAEGFRGELQYELSSAGGRVDVWAVAVGGRRARARRRRAAAPALILRMRAVDYLRMAARRLEPARGVLAGRIEVEGDFDLVTRAAVMFGQPVVD